MPHWFCQDTLCCQNCQDCRGILGMSTRTSTKRGPSTKNKLLTRLRKRVLPLFACTSRRFGCGALRKCGIRLVIWSCPDFQAPRIGGKPQVESSCLSTSKLAFWVLGRDSVWKLLLLRTYAKQRQEIPKYRCGLDQIVAAVHIQKYNKHTKKQPCRAHPSMFYNVSKGCGKALPVKAFVQFLARASRIQRIPNSWTDIFGVAFMDWNRNSSRFVQQCVGMGFQRCRQGIRTCCETVLTKQSCPNPKQMLHGLL